MSLLIGMPAAVQAKDLYECQIQQDAANGNWIAQQVIVNYDADKGEVIVFDPIIKHFSGAPIAGKVEVENAKRVTFSWRLNGAESRIGEDANFIYRLTVLKKNNVATMTAQALNYAGPFSARGTCVLSKG